MRPPRIEPGPTDSESDVLTTPPSMHMDLTRDQTQTHANEETCTWKLVYKLTTQALNRSRKLPAAYERLTKRVPHCRRKRRLTLINTWLPPTISQEQLQWRIYWHQLLQTNIMTTVNYTWQLTAFTKKTPHWRRKHRLTLFNTWLRAAYYFTRTITVTNSLTPTITNKANRMTTFNYRWQKTTFTKHTALCRRKHRLTLNNTWLPPS